MISGARCSMGVSRVSFDPLGVPLTAHDYEYAFRRLLDPTLPGRAYASAAYDIAGAQELSEFTALMLNVTRRLKPQRSGL